MSELRIRVSVEISDPNDCVEYYDLPDGWDEMTPDERDEFLVESAVEALAMQASSGACVVDENDDVVDHAPTDSQAGGSQR